MIYNDDVELYSINIVLLFSTIIITYVSYYRGYVYLHGEMWQ